MSDLIAKIGKFFAEQEAQIQQTYTQVARPPSQVPRPPHIVHQVPFPVAASPLEPERRLIQKPPRANSFIRRRLSFPSVTESPPETESPQVQAGQGPTREELFDGDQHQNKLREISAVLLSMARPASKDMTLSQDVCNHRLSGGLASWPSSHSSASFDSGGSSTKSEGHHSQSCSDSAEKQRKPRPPQQKVRMCSRKKKRGVTTKRSGNQESEQPDPRAAAKMNAVKIEAALALAQERARLFQQEQMQLAKERERDRQENALRVQEQMMKIEAVRARSFRGSHSSLVTTVNSSLQSIECESSNNETESVWTAETEDIMEHLKPSEFMTALEMQLRDKMSLEMRLKENCIEKHKQRERIRLKLDMVLQQNAAKYPKVARLSATKATLEIELSAVLAETAEIRNKRRDLENSDQKERVRRQREAERELQIRLREEEWSCMMEEEKAQSEVAAEARAKANQRVVARAASLRKMLQAYRYEPHRSNDNNPSSSTQSSNNGGDYIDDESVKSSTRRDIHDHPNTIVQPFKMNFFLPPELADFEEDGLCGDQPTVDHCLEAFKSPRHDDILETRPEAPSALLREAEPADKEATQFRWQIPSFFDQAKFAEAIIDMVSDEEDDD